MRFVINCTEFISVIQKENNTYSCQVMELVHGIGMYPASLIESFYSYKNDIVSCLVHDSNVFKETSKTVNTIEEVALFHEQCVIDYYTFVDLQNESELNTLENQTYEG